MVEFAKVGAQLSIMDAHRTKEWRDKKEKCWRVKKTKIHAHVALLEVMVSAQERKNGCHLCS